jgi:hypothetical protein
MARDGLTEPIRHRRERTPLPAWAQEMPAKNLRGFPAFGGACPWGDSLVETYPPPAGTHPPTLPGRRKRRPIF